MIFWRALAVEVLSTSKIDSWALFLSTSKIGSWVPVATNTLVVFRPPGPFTKASDLSRYYLDHASAV
jgi:hypothetical protein